MRKISDVTLGLVNKGYSIIIGLVSSVFYIRYLGIENKGTWSYLNEIAAVAAIVGTMGLNQSYALMRRKKGNVVSDYKSLFFWQFILLTVLCGALSLSIGNNILVLAVMQIPPLVLKTETETMVQIERIRLFEIGDMVSKGILLCVYIVLWRFFPVRLLYLFIPVVALRVAESAVYFALLPGKTGRVNGAFLRETLSFGFVPMLSALLVTFNYSLDIFFLRAMGTAEELSLYTIAALIMNYVWMLPNAFKEVLLSRMARRDDRSALALSIRCSLILTFCCLCGFALIGKWALGLLFGEAFRAAYPVTLVLFIGAFPMIYYKMLGVVFLAEGRTRAYFLVLLLSVMLNTVSNIICIPRFGMYGAAISSVVSYSACGFLFVFIYAKYKKEPLHSWLWPGKT